MRLYPTVVVEGQSFKGCKVYTVPQQNMSLREIIKRFVRREQLPVSHSGVYIENLGDLEKLARADIFERVEQAKELKEYIAKAKVRMEDLQKKKVADAPVVPPTAGVAASASPDGGG